MSQAFTDLRFFYRGPLEDSDGEWTDLTETVGEGEDAEEVVNTFSPGDFSLLFLAGQADDNDFSFRVVQGIKDPDDENADPLWLVVNDGDEELDVTAGGEPGDGVLIQLGLPVCKLQYKCSADVGEAIMAVQARWAGR